MHFLRLFLAASSLTISFCRPNALSPLDPAIRGSEQQSQVSLDSRYLSKGRIAGSDDDDDDDDSSLRRNAYSWKQSAKQSSLKLQKRSGSLRPLQPEIIEHILDIAMGYMYQAKRSSISYTWTWCEVLCMAYHDVITGYLDPSQPNAMNKRFRECQNFCDNENFNSDIRKEYTQYELILRAKFAEYSIQKAEEEWRRLRGNDQNFESKNLDLKDKGGTVFSNLTEGFRRIAGAMSKAGSLHGKPGGHMGGVHPFPLKGVP